jgi:CheY-like chemotaxis protein
MGGRVLLIEDEPNIIEAVRFILSRDGWAVDTHSDGATAMEAIRRRKPDGVILDAMLPNRSGYDILADLRSAEDTRRPARADADRARPDQGPRNGRALRRLALHDQALLQRRGTERAARDRAAMRDQQEPLFLARQGYRRRRLEDAARLLPWLGAFLFGLPLLWTGARTAPGLVYLFAAWIVLIAVALVLSRRLARAEGPGEGDGRDDDMGA